MYLLQGTKRASLLSFFLLLLFSLNSCTDLKNIQQYSESSAKTLETIPELDYSFSSHYRDYELKKRLLPYTDEDLLSGKIDIEQMPKSDTAKLKLFKKADEVIGYFTNSLLAYFQALTKLSGKELVNYDFDKFAGGIKSSTDIKNFLSLSDAQIDAGAKVAKFLTDKIMSRYREKKLRQAIKTADPDISLTTNALKQALGSLHTNINNSKSLLKVNFEKLLAVTKLSFTEQLNLKYKYQEELQRLENSSKKILLLIKNLDNIRDGHNKIAQELNNGKKLTNKEVVALLKEYGTEMYDVFQQIKSLLKK